MTFEERFAFLKRTYGDEKNFAGIDTDLAAEITLTDEEGGGTFYIEHKNGKTSMEPYDYRDASVRIRLPYGLLLDILEDRKSAVAEFMASNVDAEGEPGDALALLGAMRAGKEQKAPKKSTRSGT